MKYFTVFIISLLFIITICFEHHRNVCLTEQLEKLKTNNERLKATIERFSFSPVVIPKERVIRLGQEYVADIRLAFVDTLNPPVVLATSDSIGYDEIKDTLLYNKFDQVSTYKITPTKKGNYYWKGKIINLQGGKREEYLFESGFIVQ